jgi:hypothetical protein
LAAGGAEKPLNRLCHKLIKNKQFGKEFLERAWQCGKVEDFTWKFRERAVGVGAVLEAAKFI